MITDDTGTQGKGNMQFEFFAEYGQNRERGITEKIFKGSTIPVFSFGVSDTTDIVFGLPYISVRTEEAGTMRGVGGIGDASIDVKARFYDKEGLSLALKPGISLPTANEGKGLGNGKKSYGMFLITTKEAGLRAFHFNLGYARNEYEHQADEHSNRKYIWYISLASQIEVVKDVNFVADIGMSQNVDKSSKTDPAFALAGITYSVRKNLDLDFGIKRGLNKAETDYAVLAGITWRL
jgi:hypothetical protein